MTRIVLFFDIDNPNPAANPADDTFQIDDLVFGAYGTMSTKDFEIEGLKIYPNPANDAWTISTTNQIIETVEIFNILGNRVLSINPNALSARLNASNLTAGIYFANITTELGSTSRKLIKQ
ncbi:MAG: T9SS type A sorting domain-containing protein, partial [Ignavibacteriaceae bacterium]|nr:T9SS type A sorting domain-containing protein [Ignavibacteriaceae bacterium]